MSANNKQTDILNNLITTLYDGENGYKEAAEDCNNVVLANRFRDLAKQRYDFGHEIKPLIKSLGGVVDKGGSTVAAIHRIWMDLKSAVSKNDELAVIQECIRGEEYAIGKYEEALADAALTGAARTTVSDQLSRINTSLVALRQLQDTFATV